MMSLLKSVGSICITGIAVLLVHQPSASASDDVFRASDTAKVGETNEISEKESPFWKNAQAFVDAYAKRDAEAIGRLFTQDAEFYDEFGELTVGRDAITRLYQQVFNESPEALVEEIKIERVKMINETVALEEGAVATSEFSGGPRETSRYIALHVKEADGVWRINTLKDYTRAKASAAEQLSQLSWLVGEWMSEDSSSVVHIECRWSDDGNYLLRRFTAQIAGRAVMNGTQRIGWDPVRREIRSWLFDSEGGYVEGSWRRSGRQWIVTTSGFNPEGETASGLAIYTIHNPERISWQYRNLVVGSELREDIEPIVMVRRPPSARTKK